APARGDRASGSDKRRTRRVPTVMDNNVLAPTDSGGGTRNPISAGPRDLVEPIAPGRAARRCCGSGSPCCNKRWIENNNERGGYSRKSSGGERYRNDGEPGGQEKSRTR